MSKKKLTANRQPLIEALSKFLKPDDYLEQFSNFLSTSVCVQLSDGQPEEFPVRSSHGELTESSLSGAFCDSIPIVSTIVSLKFIAMASSMNVRWMRLKFSH